MYTLYVRLIPTYSVLYEYTMRHDIASKCRLLCEIIHQNDRNRSTSAGYRRRRSLRRRDVDRDETFSYTVPALMTDNVMMNNE